MKKTDLEKAETSVSDFCERFNGVFTITNAKGLWTGRMTVKNIQIFLSTGQTFFGCLVDAGERCLSKRDSLGV